LLQLNTNILKIAMILTTMVNFKILNFIILDIFLMIRKIEDRLKECLKADVNPISLIVVVCV